MTWPRIWSRRSRAQSGSGGVVLVCGDAGVGKTRLVEHVAQVARDRSMRTLRGRAVESELPVALRPFAEALTAAVRVYGTPQAEDDPSTVWDNEGGHSAREAPSRRHVPAEPANTS